MERSLEWARDRLTDASTADGLIQDLHEYIDEARRSLPSTSTQQGGDSTVIEEELKDVSSEVPPLTPLSVKVQTEQEQKVVNQLSKMIRIIGDRVQGDQEFQDAIDGVAQAPGSRWDRFKEVAHKVFEHGITWERIAVLFYVAGRLAVKRSCCATGQQDRDAPSALANGPYTPWWVVVIKIHPKWANSRRLGCLGGSPRLSFSSDR
ncbi:hypothetical protein INR49_018423 [Caranx melampygus]|nr:hypothetical protein INR49_018423 [Caranx melampygus]